MVRTPSAWLSYLQTLILYSLGAAVLAQAHLFFHNLIFSAFFYAALLYLVSRLNWEAQGRLKLPFLAGLIPSLLIGWLAVDALLPYLSSPQEGLYALAGSVVLAGLMAYKTKAWLKFHAESKE